MFARRLKTPKIVRKRTRSFYSFPLAASSALPRCIFRAPLSVVLPVYNHASMVEESLCSILASRSHPGDQVIVVDDGSTDDFDAAITPFLDTPSVQIVRQENRGLAEALNAGFRHAAHPLLTWTSADNQYEPEALDRLRDFLLANPSVGLTYANVRLINEEGLPYIGSGYRPQDQYPDGAAELYLPLEGETLAARADNFINACFLYRGQLARLSGDYDKDKWGYEDYDFWLRLSRAARVQHLDSDSVLYNYRLHANSMTAELDLQKTRAFCEELCSRTQLERDFTRSPSLSCSASSATNKELSSFLAAAQGDGANETLTLTLPGGLKQSLTVEALTPKLRYRHPEHTRLHAGYSFPPYFLRNEQRSLLLAPPLTPNAMLHRARSTDFHAVERASSVKGVCLAFVPEGKGAPQWVAQLKHCFAQLSDVQLVLISESKEQRALAATLGQTVPHLLNIDLGEQSEAERIEALMFALSSVDVVLSLFSSEETLQNNVLELRTEAALAASAGIGVISLVERLQLEELENAHYSPAAELLPMPHLAIISPAEGKNLNSCPHLSSKLRSCVLELGEGVAANSLEQWLEDAGTTAIYRRIKALALA